MTRCRRVFDTDDDNLDGMVKDRSWLRGRYSRPIARINLMFVEHHAIIPRFNFIDLFIFIFTEMQCRNHYIYDRKHAISVTITEDWIRARSQFNISYNICFKRSACWINCPIYILDLKI